MRQGQRWIGWGLLALGLAWLYAAPLLASEGLSRQQLLEMRTIWKGKRTTKQVLERYGDLAEERLRPRFEQAGLAYPPQRISLLALKEEKRMELWAWHQDGWRHIHDYPILGASGHAGPKLRQGDKQVPEGVYRVLYLNPNSNYHLSMKLNYPNQADRQRAQREGRTNLGGDIFIHGTEYSIGCLAIGNPAIQELYVLAARTGVKNIETIIAPYDFRRHKPLRRHDDPEWVDDLYAQLSTRLQEFPRGQGQRQVADSQAAEQHPADVLGEYAN
ncbi:MAG: L,D-transpeptidase family protein [Gammaproteobacteria bacterium SHHR-1]